MTDMINLQIASFAGLGLPRTLNRPVAAATPACDVLQQIYDALPNPELGPRLIVSTTDGHALSLRNTDPISTLASGSSILPLRLSTRLCGGKGGFGSQLRAAGGRMSSRKNKDRQNAIGSNRNLDGRRLRTVEEAKKLAQYLEMKPEMERKEKEERRERWESVIKAADETEERIKSGKMGRNQGRLDADYVENKELAEERVRDAVARAMRESVLQTERTGSESSVEAAGSSSSAHLESSGSDEEVRDRPAPSFFGWDEEDDDDSGYDEQYDESQDDSQRQAGIATNLDAEHQLQHDLEEAVPKGKGKGKAL